MTVRGLPAWTAVVATLVLGGCAPWQSYQPRLTQPGELTLRQGRRLELYAGQRRLTQGPVFGELEHYVRCVPRARRHARSAQRSGRRSRGLRWTGGTMGAASLGGLAGIGVVRDDPQLGWALLGAGIGTALVGVIVSGSSRTAGNRANGHAVDAMNYYNDALGAYGSSCDTSVGVHPTYEEAEGVLPPASALPPAAAAN